ncbi:MAG: helix-turn-helix domain-containing protein [Peptostreptococcaceae bacterium]
MIKELDFNDYCIDETKLYIADLRLFKGKYTTEHNHNFYEMFIVLNGKFKHLVNGKDELLKSRDLKIIKPQDSHYFIGDEDINILRNIAIEKSYFEKLISNLNKDINTQNKLNISEVIYQNYIYKTDIIMSKSYNETNYILESLITDIIIEINMNKNDINNIPKWLEIACLEMSNKENFIKGLDRFIEISGVSQEHLTRELKKYYNVTPTQFINNLRIVEVSNMLKYSDISIIDIALDYGFDNISYFNRLFKKKFNVTPSIYRKNNKEFFL